MDGVSHFVLDNRPEAANSFERSIESDPTASNAHHNLGVLAWREGDTGAARIHMERALRIHPYNKVYVLTYAALLAELDERPAAVQALESFLREHPEKQMAEYLKMLVQCTAPPIPAGLCVDLRSANTRTDIFPVELKPSGSGVCSG